MKREFINREADMESLVRDAFGLEMVMVLFKCSYINMENYKEIERINRELEAINRKIRRKIKSTNHSLD